jgi:hypothetical protein
VRLAALGSGDGAPLRLRIESHSGGLAPVRPTRIFADLADPPDRRRNHADLSLVVARGLLDLHGCALQLDDGEGQQAVEILLPPGAAPAMAAIAASRSGH